MKYKTLRVVLNFVPPSLNHAYVERSSKGRVYKFPTKEAKTFKKKLGEAFIKKYPDLEPLNQHCSVRIRLWFGDKRRRDVDNYSKIVFDGLNKLVYDDDCLVTQQLVEKEYCKGVYKTEITIVEGDKFDKS